MKIADISKWQGEVDWKAASTELDFVILRASCGLSKDVMYSRNVAGCHENGIAFGAYHYVMAGTEERAREEAKKFIEYTNSEDFKPNFYIADIEYEAQTDKTTESVCVAFLEELRAAGCEKIGLYINRKYRWAGKSIGMCDIMWIPHWGTNDGEVPADKYKSEYPHDLWQYTSKGRLAGVEGNVDLNILTGTKPLEYFTGADADEPNSTDAAEKMCKMYLVSLGMYASEDAAEEVRDKAIALGFDASIVGIYSESKEDESEGIEIDKGTWNIRRGPGTAYGIVGIAHEGEVYQVSGEMTDEWTGIIYRGEKAWIYSGGIIQK